MLKNNLYHLENLIAQMEQVQTHIKNLIDEASTLITESINEIQKEKV